MKAIRRVFVPARTYVERTSILTQVRRWIWTRNRGLMVEYADGLTLKSDYRSLSNMLKAEHVSELAPTDALFS